MDELVRRALIAYLRKAEDVNLETLHAGIETVDHLRYVVIRGRTELLAVFRVRHDNKLKRLRRKIPHPLK